jgi:glycosyltransferase involved in cell wall biosynthesis
VRRALVVSSYPPRHCGIGAYARATVERLREEGWRVVVVSPPDGDGDLRVPFDRGAPFRKAASVGSGFELVQVHFQPALYYMPGARAALSKMLTSASLLWLVLRRRQTEIVVHEADRPQRWRPDFALLRQAFAHARLAFHTEAERETLERDYRIRARARIVDHTEGVRVHAPLSRADARRRLRLSADERLYVCAGFLHPDKGFERAVRAFGRAAPRGRRLVVVGSVRDRTPANVAYARMLRDLCERTPGVTLVEGYVSDEDFDAWVAAADRLVLPYRRSWSSGALARARKLGTPAVVAAVGGLQEQAGPDDKVFAGDADLAALLGAPSPAEVPS